MKLSLSTKGKNQTDQIKRNSFSQSNKTFPGRSFNVAFDYNANYQTDSKELLN